MYFENEDVVVTEAVVTEVNPTNTPVTEVNAMKAAVTEVNSSEAVVVTEVNSPHETVVTELNSTDSIFNSILISQIFGKDPSIIGRKEVSDNDRTGNFAFKSNLFTDQNSFDVLMQESLIDLNIIVSQRILGVHQIVMCAHSSLVEVLLREAHQKGLSELNTGFKTQQMDERVSLILPDYSLKAMTKVINFLYSGELTYNPEDFQEIKSIASDLDLKHLLHLLNVSSPENLSHERIVIDHQDPNQNISGHDQARVVIGQSGPKYLAVIGEDGTVVVGEEEGEEEVEDDDEYYNFIGVVEKVLMAEADLETPVQSPLEAPPNSPLKENSDQQLEFMTDTSGTFKNMDSSQFCNYQCPECSQLFNSHEELNHHMQSHETPTSEKTAESLQCEVCKNHFDSADNLEKHKETAHEGKSFQCGTCNKYFTRSHHLKIHKRIHTGEKPYACTECKKRFIDNSGLKEHMRIHSDELGYKCTTCNKGFKLRSTLRQHMRTHTEKSFQCNICDKKFTLKLSLIRHSEIHTQVNQRIKQQNQLIKCNHCHATFTTEAALAEHSSAKHPDTGHVSTSLVYRCWMRNCSKVFPSEDLLTSHRQIVHGSVLQSADMAADDGGGHVENNSGRAAREQLFVCSCGVKFANSRTLKQHQKTWHAAAAATSFRCNLCSKAFKNDCDLVRHMLEHSDGAGKKHICGYCSKAWDKASDLAKHIRIHTGEKPYKCNLCDKAFSDVSLFKKHQRKHEGAGSAPSFACDTCNKTFQKLENLERHKEQHSGLAVTISCPVCKKMFYDETSMSAHLSLHSGNPLLPFPCHYCHKRFKRSYDMRKHERVHTREQPYACAECSTRFSDLSSLRRHQKIHAKVA